MTKGKRKRKTKGRAKVAWTEKIPIRAQAMVVTEEHLILAGAPDVVDKDDVWAAFDGRKGGRLEVRAKANGKKLDELALPAPPVHDGMAAAEGRVYVSLGDGSLVCLESP